MGLGIDDPAVHRDDAVIVREEKEEILESLSQEETLHLVSVVRVGDVHHIVD